MNSFYSLKTLFVFLFSVVILTACGDTDKQSEKEEKEEKSATINSSALERTLLAFPSPIELISHIQTADVSYDRSLSHDASRKGEFSGSTDNQALNLGVFLTDLGYACLYTENQASIDYLKASKSLTEDLGILKAFESEFITRFENNLDNRDSLVSVVREGYYFMEDYLKQNERNDALAMLLTGMWTQGLFISTELIQDDFMNPKFEVVRIRIGEQKVLTPLLVELLEPIKKKSEKISMISAELEALNEIYAKVEVIEREDDDEYLDIAEVDDIAEITDKLIMQDLSKVEITEDELKAIHKSIQKLRSIIIS
ncbi:MAG: hypothetical protein LAT68_09660 [Cyclobacteriaceae bacterium]|nr:hypothetical protein [Cyclobacteriaceae bacterium]MCH8516581.1 hypothetical protein [Cyclobacteriaceae bacterium]